MITYILYLILGSIAVGKLKATWLTICWFAVMAIDFIVSIYLLRKEV